MSDSQAAVMEETATIKRAKKATATNAKRKQQPRYNVILWDDPEHTFEYVARMMVSLFRFTHEQGLVLAKRVDTSGRAVCLTTTREHAELKRDQIKAFGRDPLSARSHGSMSATIEAVRE
jgi:ATP-dependent Clp protease adaptor protein ClpS